jgi:site-specific recombinase XerC
MSRGLAAATAAGHYRRLQHLFRGLDEEGEIPQSPMAKMRPPQVPEQPVPVIPDDDLAKLLKACTGDTFAPRRDAARCVRAQVPICSLPSHHSVAVTSRPKCLIWSAC